MPSSVSLFLRHAGTVFWLAPARSSSLRTRHAFPLLRRGFSTARAQANSEKDEENSIESVPSPSAGDGDERAASDISGDGVAFGSWTMPDKYIVRPRHAPGTYRPSLCCDGKKDISKEVSD
mmetsp:Transcript_22567/g.51694  ORF Transcript_22567/g.51694 Transcript_22567/m.51694 type:complete len:121 (-) Transcript_22567:307-669(-)|eukprot:CAMPEP_0113301928 /NCGR_PEP_ID=MMETSP0010_2-20120614/2948_1 /TAXON_ID=216773 ORGANISM="Corethron hystrix, Strain 308" /NCGR_SAMPLE_ID=MMETSP0010_2 /ASSEMBLY_ACC=CAM_ASM_000155 /LENGTH=120 /DNA_ID=CAMNT_0000155623 /DNA_START=137 /DNA_END=499 /DNA_ORIENTATION=+ /assembly_acc=CAM_ASM_000155